jgi:hypothetical protein
MQTTQNDQTSKTDSQPLDILQQFDGLLKTHSIVVTDREILVKLFERIMDLCTQMPKTKLKAAFKAATKQLKEPKQLKESKQPKEHNTKTPPKTKAKEVMVGPDDAADAPTIADLTDVPAVRGRGRPRKNESTTAHDTATDSGEKKRRGRPKKDKTMTISSNDDEDALIAKMMEDVASVQKHEDAMAATMASALDAPSADLTDGEETESECSISPVIVTTTFTASVVEVETDSSKPKSKPVKEVKAQKEFKPKPVKEVKAKPVKAQKEVKTQKEVKAQQQPLAVPVAAPSTHRSPRAENQEVNGRIYLMANFPTHTFSWNGQTYLRTETDNVYDTMTFEMVGVWDHSNHEIIYPFDDEEDDEMLFSEEE